MYSFIVIELIISVLWIDVKNENIRVSTIFLYKSGNLD